MSKRNVFVNTYEFEKGYGHRPRGYGHWAFFFNASRKLKDAWWYEGKFSDARKAALIEARKRYAFEIYVGL